MSGTINWKATYQGTGEANAELYDSGGNVARSEPIPCDPPVNCPFPMDNLGFGTYTAALVIGPNRYYYDSSQQVISAPDAASSATPITISSDSPTANIKIRVQEGQPA